MLPSSKAGMEAFIQCLIRSPFAGPLGVVCLECRNSRSSPDIDNVSLRYAPEIALIGYSPVTIRLRRPCTEM